MNGKRSSLSDIYKKVMSNPQLRHRFISNLGSDNKHALAYHNDIVEQPHILNQYLKETSDPMSRHIMRHMVHSKPNELTNHIENKGTSVQKLYSYRDLHNLVDNLSKASIEDKRQLLAKLDQTDYSRNTKHLADVLQLTSDELANISKQHPERKQLTLEQALGYLKKSK